MVDKSERDERLAKALRDNLKRRKAGRRGLADPGPPGDPPPAD